MFLVYVAAGILLVIMLHAARCLLRRAAPDQAFCVQKWLFIAAALLLLLALLRVGQPYIAALVSGFLALLAILSRLAALAPLYGLFQRNRSAKSTGMSVKEAAEILGIDEDASPEAITAAHRRLMQKLHPDAGGNEYLASQLNAAKEVLMNRQEKH